MQEKLAVVCKFGLGDEFMMDDKKHSSAGKMDFGYE